MIINLVLFILVEDVVSRLAPPQQEPINLASSPPRSTNQTPNHVQSPHNSSDLPNSLDTTKIKHEPMTPNPKRLYPDAAEERFLPPHIQAPLPGANIKITSRGKLPCINHKVCPVCA